jgi:hypothetical protein
MTLETIAIAVGKAGAKQVAERLLHIESAITVLDRKTDALLRGPYRAGKDELEAAAAAQSDVERERHAGVRARVFRIGRW